MTFSTIHSPRTFGTETVFFPFWIYAPKMGEGSEASLWGRSIFSGDFPRSLVGSLKVGPQQACTLKPIIGQGQVFSAYCVLLFGRAAGEVMFLPALGIPPSTTPQPGSNLFYL